MASGVWIYNWLEKCFKWVENGRAYSSPAQVPTNKTKRPYIDPGRKVVKK